ncbi:MAG TPA: hypothetical protein VGR87_05950 [Candidatus Limnocylindria bacterium]|nr:hypothetical protein [Candidatus Limnocylindria bacterium]
MLVGSSPFQYEWIGDWARLPNSDEQLRAWPHHGLVVTRAGEILIFDPTQPRLLRFDGDGYLLGTSSLVEAQEAHGMTLVLEDTVERLWIADAGQRRTPTNRYKPPPEDSKSVVLKVTLDGHTLQRLPRPPHPAYVGGSYRPTGIAVSEGWFGGNGDVWVADGYGESYVHRFASDGTYLGSLSGEAGAGRFKEPHAVYIDHRRDQPELYVADRANARIQVYDLEGRFRRVVGEGILSTPSFIASDGQRLFVIENRPPRLTVLDQADRLLVRLGEDPDAPSRPGWPNAFDANGNVVRATTTQGKLNSPHALALDPNGNIYLTEWLIGGRFTQLRKTA